LYRIALPKGFAFFTGRTSTPLFYALHILMAARVESCNRFAVNAPGLSPACNAFA
jgi:hypothetical protein